MGDVDAFERRNRLVDDCRAWAKTANRRATAFRAASAVANFAIIAMGIGVGFAGVLGGAVPSLAQGALYAAAFLGFGVSAAKGALTAFDVEARGVLNKQRAVALRALARRLERGAECGAELERAVARAEDELDQMELESFGAGTRRSPRAFAGFAAGPAAAPFHGPAFGGGP